MVSGKCFIKFCRCAYGWNEQQLSEKDRANLSQTAITLTRVDGSWCGRFYDKLYIDETGDIEILDEQAAYFKDRQVGKRNQKDDAWDEAYGCWQKTKTGTIRECIRILLQNLTAFMRLGNMDIHFAAPWNDDRYGTGTRGERCVHKCLCRKFKGQELWEDISENRKSTVFLAKRSACC